MLFVAVLFVSSVGNTEGLAFVTSIMRTPIPLLALNPLKILANRKSASTPSPSTAAVSSTVSALQAHGEALPLQKQQVGGAATTSDDFVMDDASLRTFRSEVVDLVYARSLDRMNGFASE